MDVLMAQTGRALSRMGVEDFFRAPAIATSSMASPSAPAIT